MRCQHLPNYLVTVSGEAILKSSRSRPKFFNALIRNISDAVSRAGGRVISIDVVEAKIHLVTDVDAIDAISRVFGVYRVGRVLVYEFRDLSDLTRWVAENSKDVVVGRRFAVRVKRSGVHSFTSIDVAREVGALLKPFSSGVDLDNPEVVVEVEVRGSKAFLYRDSVKGPGGLPTGVEGRALVLFSGGFDSPVAAWYTARRGVEIGFLHFILGPLESTYNAFVVAKKLSFDWLYGYRPKFIAIDFRDVVKEIVEKVDWSYRQVVLRALMYLAASKIVEELGYDAIVTGESLGQASSQTLKNIAAIESCIRMSKPILRPLISFDKEEIIELSRRLGLYELSSKVVEACAIAPSKVVTAATSDGLSKRLGSIDMKVVEEALKKRIIVSVLEARSEDVIPETDIEIDFIPSNALIIDARKETGVGELPIGNAIPLNKVDFSSIPPDKPIIIICDTGGLSYIIAKELREKGFKAYSLRGGAKACKVFAENSKTT